MDELVGEGDPAVLGKDAHQFLFDFLGCVAFGQAEAAGDAEDVGVDDYAFGLAERNAEDDVGGFAGCSGDFDELGKGFGDLAVEFRDDLESCALNGFGFVVKEACCADEGFEFRQCCLGHSGWGGEALEQFGRDHVDADVCALGGEDGGDEELPGRAVGEGALDGGVGFVEGFEDGGDAVGGQVAAWSGLRFVGCDSGLGRGFFGGGFAYGFCDSGHVFSRFSLMLSHILENARPVELARRIGTTKQEVNRLTDLKHATKIDRIDAALRALGKRLVLDAA